MLKPEFGVREYSISRVSVVYLTNDSADVVMDRFTKTLDPIGNLHTGHYGVESITIKECKTVRWSRSLEVKDATEANNRK